MFDDGGRLSNSASRSQKYIANLAGSIPNLGSGVDEVRKLRRSRKRSLSTEFLLQQSVNQWNTMQYHHGNTNTVSTAEGNTMSMIPPNSK